MLFLEALKKANESGILEKFNGYFLGSMFTALARVGEETSEWTLHFCNPTAQRAVDVIVSESVSVEESVSARETKPLDVSLIKVEGCDAVKAAMMQYNGDVSRILLVLHNPGRPVWNVNIVSSALNATTFTLDAASGEILASKSISLLQRFNPSDDK